MNNPTDNKPGLVDELERAIDRRQANEARVHDQLTTLVTRNKGAISAALRSHERMREALEEVMRYRRGEGEYRFADLPDSEREIAMFDAWQEVEARIITALKETDNDNAG